MDDDSRSPVPGHRKKSDDEGRRESDASIDKQTNGNDSYNGHVRVDEPSRPQLFARNTFRAQSSKSVSDAMRQERARQEQETLLGCEELADDDGCYPPRLTDEPIAPNPHKQLPIYTTIHKIRRLVIATIDDPYSAEQLKSPRLNVAIVRPLVDHLYDPDDVSVVYCLLVNRVQFLREQSFQAHHQTVNLTRATLCELVASRVLRRYDEDHEGREGLLKVANVLVAGFEAFQNAPLSIIRNHRTEPSWTTRYHLARPEYERMLTALEVAIVSEAKGFLATSACQKIVENVYRGRIIYTPTSFIDILPDHYKNRGISLYDPNRAPLLNQYRLLVPRTHSIIEVVQFVILLGLYILMMVNKEHSVGPAHLKYTLYELIFDIYALGWCLDEIASVLEHGWTVHTENLWSFLDISFVLIFSTYLGVRIKGFLLPDTEGSSDAELAINIISMAAPVLLPRLAFCLMPESMLFIALRAMMSDFLFLTLLAVWCFGGFLMALRWVSESHEGYTPASVFTIAKWMLNIWFGLDATGINESVHMHWFLGPTLMVCFAFLGNTLFLTILVAMLSNTYTTLANNATAEIQFRRAVLTFEGVKSDSLFAYRPPLNFLALITLLPLKFILSPRWFHKVNVAAIRVTNAPILVVLSLYERKYLWQKPRQLTPPRRLGWVAAMQRMGPHKDLSAVFDADPPQDIIDEMDDVDDILDELWDGSDYIPSLQRRRSMSNSSGQRMHSRSRGLNHPNGFRRRRGSRREDAQEIETQDV